MSELPGIGQVYLGASNDEERTPTSLSKVEYDEFCVDADNAKLRNAVEGEVRVVNEKTGGEKGQKNEQYSQLYWPFIADLARVYAFGSIKYSRGNYAKGYSWSLSLDAAMRHIAAFAQGERLDPESGLSHLAHAAWHMSALFLFNEHHPELDDLKVI